MNPDAVIAALAATIAILRPRMQLRHINVDDANVAPPMRETRGKRG